MKTIPLHQRPLIYAAIRIAKRQPDYKSNREFILKAVPYPELAFLKNIPNHDIQRYSQEESTLNINDFYTNLDQKNGVVITPAHIANIMLALIDDPKGSLYDPCAGTGRLLEQHPGPKIANELDHNNAIIAEAVLDSKVAVGDCMLQTLPKKAKNSIINPPYSLTTPKELEIVLHTIDNTEPGGRVVFVVPTSTGTAASNNLMKEEILKNNTLEAGIAIPKHAFPGVGTSTIIFVVKVGIPHLVSKQKTMFVNFENDGYSKPTRGKRKEINFEERKKSLLDTLNNRESESGLSAFVNVDHEDEWGVEAHAYFVDYSKLTQENFINDLKERLIYEYRSA